MNEIIRQKKSASPWRLDCLVVTALFDVEYESLSNQLDTRVANAAAAPKVEREKRWEQADLLQGVERWKLTYNDEEGPKRLTLGTSHLRRMGIANAAVQIHRLVDFYNPNFVLMAGIAGSLEPEKVRLGDVVIGNFVRWEGYDKISPKDDGCWELRPTETETLKMHDGIVATMRTFAGDEISLPSNDATYRAQFPKLNNKTKAPRPNEVHVGGIMSWDYVLNHKDIRDAKHRAVTPEVLAVDMESAGLLFALSETPTKAIVFRGISDECHKKPDSKAKDPWRKIAADNAVACMFRFLEVHGPALR